ncbi:unnamed protein product [Moneuplotes crassus]|uniref:TLDc domain-containing protein n=1 Tax=Euplotes crassus TaxID=5936 RepID=A0AAD1UFS8_EUPCR|nr:unnamed protein product [Moneuplotes crassus]
MKRYDFRPLRMDELDRFETMFEYSKILDKNSLPNIVSYLPKLRMSSLLFQVDTTQEKISPMDFHDECDDKGPTLMIVKTKNDKIFGAYCPVSWISENMYTETEESFIFTLDNNVFTMYNIFEPLLAVKQSQYQYSPCFGEVDKADLFISFKYPQKSYAMLGNVYKKIIHPDIIIKEKLEVNYIEIYAVNFE